MVSPGVCRSGLLVGEGEAHTVPKVPHHIAGVNEEMGADLERSGSRRRQKKSCCQTLRRPSSRCHQSEGDEQP